MQLMYQEGGLLGGGEVRWEVQNGGRVLKDDRGIVVLGARGWCLLE